MRVLAVLAAFAALLASINALTVHLVPHTHDDVGWLKTVDQYYVGLHREIQDAAVQHTITSTIAALKRVPERKFVYVEQAFFQRWWREQNDAMKATVKELVANKQLEFINGGWCMHDEATTHFVDMIDQTALGHQFIREEFGESAIPTVGWQIDPFGHSATQAALLGAEVGLDAMFFARIDYQDHTVRLANKALETVWSASPTYGPSNYVFADAMYFGYGPPGGMCWDEYCGDEPVQDDMRLEDYNVPDRVADFIKQAMNQAGGTRGDLDTMNVMWTMGSDFMYQNAEKFYINMDKIIAAVNANGTVKAMYSTPSIYLKAKNAEPVTWPVKTDDYFPYADGPTSYWTGYFTSRPALKKYVRTSSAHLQVVRHFEVVTGANGTASERLWEAQSVAQHHDAVAGTEKQAVAFDYAQRIARGTNIADEFLATAIGEITSAISGATPLQYNYCPLANVSVCAQSQVDGNLVVLSYNPLGRSYSSSNDASLPARTRVPTNNPKAIAVDSTGKPLPLQQTVPVFATQSVPAEAAKYEVVFSYDLPALGIATNFITANTSAQTVKQSKKMAPVTSISNNQFQVNFDSASGAITSIVRLEDKKSFPFTADFAWYSSYQGDGQDSGAYIFLPANDHANPLNSGSSPAKILSSFQGALVSEIWIQASDWIQYKVVLYNDEPVIEFQWTVGPVPIDDQQGKEVVIRFNSSLQSQGTFYTDSNGREFQKRVRDYRPSWKWYRDQNVTSNYYPVNAVAYLTDGTDSMVVLNDRSQGGASLSDGELEFMVHRRMTKDDGRGVGEPLSEPGLDGKGLIITGSHWLSIQPAADVAPVVARAAQSVIFAPPHVTYTPLTGSPADYAKEYTLSLSFLNTELPVNVDLITFQVHDDGNILIRLAHLFGVSEGKTFSQPVTVDLSTLFVQAPSAVRELSLTAAYSAGSHQPLKWKTEQPEYGKPPKLSTQFGPLANWTVTLDPLQIRTFVLTF